MQIWRLKPIGGSAGDWQGSTYRGEVFVRAKSEANAREIASKAFVTMSPVTSGKKITAAPWGQPALVSVMPTKDSGFAVEGIEELVSPAEAVAMSHG